MTLEHLDHFRCINSGKTWPANEALATDLWTNPEYGRDGILSLEYDLDRVRHALHLTDFAKRPWSLGHWRYHELLPIANAPDWPQNVSGSGEASVFPALQVGGTPLSESPRLAAELGIGQVWLKDDGRNASGSLKDRPSSLGAVKAMEAGAKHAAAASTGNAASSFAASCAALGLPCTIFVPERAPRPKVVQLLMFGARVLRIQADYDTTWELCRQAAEQFGWYSRNCAVNPYLVEGKKTCALEIVEQLNPKYGFAHPTKMPDWIVASIGDGCTMAALAKGFREMHALGLASHVPRMLGTQAVGADPITQAWEQKADGVPTLTDATTIADSICVGRPANGLRCLQAINETEGAMISVDDDATMEAARVQARLTGIFGEPAAANATAGLWEARRRRIVGINETAVIVVSGNGLKDSATAAQAVGDPLDVAPTLDAVGEIIDSASD